MVRSVVNLVVIPPDCFPAAVKHERKSPGSVEKLCELLQQVQDEPSIVLLDCNARGSFLVLFVHAFFVL